MVYLQEFFSSFWGRTKDIISYLNWVDLLVIIIVARSVYIGIKRGLFIEIFKFSALVVGIYVAVTQYQAGAALLEERFSFRVAEGTVGMGLFALVYCGVTFLRFLIGKVRMPEPPGAGGRLVGGGLGFCRGCAWFVVLGTLALSLTPPSGYLAESLREKAFLGAPLLEGGEVVYRFTHRLSTSFTIDSFETVSQENDPHLLSNATP